MGYILFVALRCHTMLQVVVGGVASNMLSFIKPVPNFNALAQVCEPLKATRSGASLLTLRAA